LVRSEKYKRGSRERIMAKNLSLKVLVIFGVASMIYGNGLSAPQSLKGVEPGNEIVKREKCGSCHNLIGPAATTIEEIIKKRAPDLFYAGQKFQKKFLIKFLKGPFLIRPSGTVYLNHIVRHESGDDIKDVLPCGGKLSEKDSEAVAEFLMTLRGPELERGVFMPGKFSRTKARILFEKNMACHACHKVRNSKGVIEGGMSAPILYNAGLRLQGDWIYNFLKDQEKWYPRVWMPRITTDRESLQLLTNYIMGMKE